MGSVAPEALAELNLLPEGPLHLAWSGGADSTGLLAWLLDQPPARARGLRLLHVDHGLQADSPRWAEHCEDRAVLLGLPCAVLRIDVHARPGHSPEQAAREARYAALAAALPEGAILVTAHHQDDQAETLLLRMLRGAGLRGLGGMRRLRRFGSGWLWRPMLDQPRARLVELARRSGFGWIEDPSNQRCDADRNLIRHEILPRLQQRWPAAATRIAASAAQLQQAWPLVERSLAQTLAELQGLDPRTLNHRRWCELGEPTATLLLGHWLEQLGSSLPPPRALAELRRWQDPKPEGEYSLRWSGSCLKLWRGQLHALALADALPIPPWTLHWQAASVLQLPHQLGCLRWEGRPQHRPRLRLSSRRGGERLQVRPGGPHRSLRLLLQEAGLPPWLRERLVMVEADGMLVAVLPHWWNPDFARRLAAAGLHLHWDGSPPGLGCRDGATLNPSMT